MTNFNYKMVEEAEKHMRDFEIKQVQILIDSAIIPNELATSWKISLAKDGLTGLSGIISNAGWFLDCGIPTEKLNMDADFLALIRVMFKNMRKEEEQFKALFKWWYEDTLLERMSM